jgi:hypothetical protein
MSLLLDLIFNIKPILECLRISSNRFKTSGILGGARPAKLQNFVISSSLNADYLAKSFADLQA